VCPAAKENDVTVIYIMGYGRSGSTILDILLNQHSDVVSVGALGTVYQWLLRNERCACSAPVRECAFWNEVCGRQLQNIEEEAPNAERLQTAVESLASYPAMALGLKSRALLRPYVGQLEELVQTIASVSGKRYVVDSSKSARHYAGRALALSRHTRFNVKVIHLVRDGRGVCWSTMRGAASPEARRPSKRQSASYWRALMSWMAANYLALLTTWMLPKDAVLKVRYEDLCESPAMELARVGDFVGLDMCRVIEMIEAREELQVGHNVGGNRVRFADRLRFKPDREWQRKLPWTYRRVFVLAAWPLTALLGYSGSPRQDWS
jgi:hypothetical protein